MASRPSRIRSVEQLYSIPGSVPNPIDMPNYCYFSDHCSRAFETCNGDYPPTFSISGTRSTACYLDSIIKEGKMMGDKQRRDDRFERRPSQALLLEGSHLKSYFPISRGLFSKVKGYVKAVDDVSFSIRRGTTMGLVGESGGGKTTIGKTILRLTKITSGSVTFDGIDIHALDCRALRAFRPRIQIIFQDPYSSLSPRMLVGEIIGEAVREKRLVEPEKFD